MKYLIMVVCMLVQAMTVQAEPPKNSLKGTITDNKGSALIGVTVSLPDLKVGTVTDISGKYEIKQLPLGRYLVQVRYLGYATITKYVNIEGEKTEDFKLHESILEKTEVVITGASLATEERRSTIPIQSIRMKEMRENAFTNVIDAIAKLPGISQVSTGPAISKPVIRGLGLNRIITLNDGIRQEGQQWGDEHGIEIDDYNVSYIEVLKGPASLAYGSDALAGVVNIVTDDIIPEGKITGNAALNYQTNNALAAAHADINGNQKGISWKAYATSKAARDYKNAYDGYVFNSRFNNINYGATAGLDRKWGYSRLSFTAFRQQLGLIEGTRDSATGKFVREVYMDSVYSEQIANDELNYANATPSQKINHTKIGWSNAVYLPNGGRIGLTIGYQQNRRREFDDVAKPSTAGLEFLLKTTTYDVKYFYPVRKGWQMTTGINGMWQQNTNNGIEFLIPDYSLFDAGVYTIAKKDWKKLSLSGGLRYNYRNIKGNSLYLDSNDERVNDLQVNGYTQFYSFNRTFSNLVGSAGASYLFTKRLTMKLNIATGFRAPNAAELSANGVHEGTIRYEYGNTNLKPEQSLQADLGVNWNSGHIMVNASLFYNHISHYIYLQKLRAVSGGDSIPAEYNDDGFAAYQFSQSNAGIYGGELYIDLHPHPLDWLHLDNTLSYVRGVIYNGTDSTRNLPAIPPLKWNIELRAQSNKVNRYIRNGYAKLGLNISFAQNSIFSAFSTETATPGYSVLNAGLGFDLMNKKKLVLCSVHIVANNITDLAYQDHLNRLKYADLNNVTWRTGVYNMGRNFSLMLNVPFRFK